jgi:ABC-type Zn uptake system ZnuABC Zn-binding protein ZnuA
MTINQFTFFSFSLLTFTGILFFSPLQAQKKYKVLATASIFSDMARNIATDQIEVESIVPIGSDPHLYEPTPNDVKAVSIADLILVNGLGFEGWLKKLIDNSGTSAKIVVITNGIEAIQNLSYKNTADPHAWMNVQNGLIYIENIKNALIELDPVGKLDYEFNYGIYKQQLEALDDYVVQRISEIPENKRILITSHDAFQYYGRRYRLTLEPVLGVSTEAEVQTADIRRVISVIRKNKIPTVFIETTVNPKLLQQIAMDNNVSIGESLFSDSIGDINSPAPSYYDMIKYNTDTIVKALKKEVIIEEKQNEFKSSMLLFSIIILVLSTILIFVIKTIQK